MQMNDVNRISGDIVGPVFPNPGAIDRAGSGARTSIPVAAAPVAAGTNSSATPLGLLRALRRRLPLALALAFVITGICSTAAWYLLPQPKFKPSAKLLVRSYVPQVIFKGADGINETGDSYRRYQKTQMAMLKSRSVVNTALQQPDIKKLRKVIEQKDLVEWILENLVVQFLGDSEIMEISLGGDLPSETTALVNAISKAYLEEVVNRDQNARTQRHQRLKELSKTYADLTKSRREDLRKLAQSAGSGDRQTLVLKQQYAMDHLMTVRRELADVQSQKRKITSILKVQQPDSLQETSASTTRGAELEAMIDKHPDVSNLQDRLSEMQERLESETTHTSRVSRKAAMDPAIKALREEVESLKKQLRRKRDSVRLIVKRQLEDPVADGAAGKELSYEQQLRIIEETERSLEDEISKLSKQDSNLNSNTLDLQDLQDELKQFQDSAEKINHEVEILNVELLAPPRITLYEQANPPTTRDAKRWCTLFVSITLGSFLATLLGVGFLELQARKVDNADEVVVDLGLPLVGSLPMLPSRARHKGSLATQARDRYWYNVLLESIDATRTMLIHAARDGSYRVVMITSALSGEGKTSLASHLATSLARSGQKTLLIDADLRSPSIHKIFDLTADPGMSELLRGEAPVEDVIASTAIDELKVITAGKCDHLTLRILSQGGMGSHFAGFKEHFDFVIVDSSPVLPVADALIIAQQADAVLFSVLTDVSRKNKIHAAYQRLATLGVRVLGAVVTGVHDGSYGSNYYPGEVYSKSSKTSGNSNEAECAS
jgi:capsular exopolysaccharide synthesis family protein